MGSRGSRGPAAPRYNPGPSRPQPSTPFSQPRAQTAPPVTPQPQGGGFMRSLGAGLLGGAIGSMLFGGIFGHAGAGGIGGGGGGFGLLEILLLVGVGFLAYRFFFKRTVRPATADGPDLGSVAYSAPEPQPIAPELPAQDADLTLKQYLPDFQPTEFRDKRIDDFYRVQSCFMKRDLEPVRGKLTGELMHALEGNIQTLKSTGRINKLENIVVRDVETVEAWAEQGKLFSTVKITAQMLDYTVEETSGQVVDGSATEPTRFEEYWTFVRDIGFAAVDKDWKLTAIETA